MEKTIDQKFTQEDIDMAIQWAWRANELITGRHEFDVNWSATIIKKLGPYYNTREATTVNMLIGALKRQYKEKTGKDYQ